MKKLILIIFILPLIARAQFNFIPVRADYSSFISTDSLAFIQTYLSIFQGSLDYQKSEDGKFTASFTTHLQMMQNGKVVKNMEHQYKNTTQDTSRLQKYNQFVDIFSFELPYGTYQAKVQIKDNNSNRSGDYIMEVTTLKPLKDLLLSDIELCSSIQRDTTHNMFYKNGLKIIPNPTAVFDILHPMLYYYIELNHLSYSADKQGYYEFQYWVTNSKGDTLKNRKPVKKSIIGPTLVEAGGMNVMALPADIYFIHARVRDLTTGAIASNWKKFQVYKPTHKDTTRQKTTNALPAVADYYQTFSKEQLLEEFDEAKYIASRQEIKIFKNLQNAPAMRKFLTQFWRRRDNISQVSSGTSRREYLQRVSYVNSRFRSMGRPGWKSDRGRVYILYGEPDEYERHTNSMDLLPYVIWKYHNLEGGAEFVFVDEDGFGDYHLVHSTYRKELQNPNWQQILRRRTGSSPFNDGVNTY